jgi:hypothetical protein
MYSNLPVVGVQTIEGPTDRRHTTPTKAELGLVVAGKTASAFDGSDAFFNPSFSSLCYAFKSIVTVCCIEV